MRGTVQRFARKECARGGTSIVMNRPLFTLALLAVIVHQRRALGRLRARADDRI